MDLPIESELDALRTGNALTAGGGAQEVETSAQRATRLKNESARIQGAAKVFSDQVANLKANDPLFAAVLQGNAGQLRNAGETESAVEAARNSALVNIARNIARTTEAA